MQHPLHLVWLAPLLALLMVAQDALAVLGTGAVDEEWKERHCPAAAVAVMGAAQYDGLPSPALARRLDGAIDLYRSGCAGVVVVTGGRREGDRYSEGEAGAAYLRRHGLPAAAVVVETESRTSVENLRNVGTIVGDVRFVVVTDDLHARRTEVAARRLGLDVVVAPVRVREGRWSYALRESLGLLSYRLGVFR